MPAHDTPQLPPPDPTLPTYGPLRITCLADLTRDQITDVVIVLANRLVYMCPDTTQALLNAPEPPESPSDIDYQAVASALALSAGLHAKRGA